MLLNTLETVCNLLMRIEYRWDRNGDGGLGDGDSQTGLNVNLVTSF